MTAAFLGKLESSWPPPVWRDVTVIACVSAGADSVALLRGLAALRGHGTGSLVVAHFNHGLRGAESVADESFMRDLCGQLDLPLAVGKPSTPLKGAGGDAEPPTTSEATAREARYAFFQQVAKARGARFVATAHTADDQAETILHRVLRGTGIAGLGGIPRTRMLATGITLIRPLLTVSRAEVLQYLEAQSQPFRQDTSNRDGRFTRNRIRAELLPELERSYNPDVRGALLRLGRLAADSREIVRSLGEELVQKCLTAQTATRVRIRCQPLERFPLSVRREVVILLWESMGWPQQAMTFDHWNALGTMLQPSPPTRKQIFPGKIVASRKKAHLELARADELSHDNSS